MVCSLSHSVTFFAASFSVHCPGYYPATSSIASILYLETALPSFLVLCPLAPNLIWVTSSIDLDVIQVFLLCMCLFLHSRLSMCLFLSKAHQFTSKKHKLYKRLSLTPDYIRSLFVKCASRQARVSLSSIT